MSELQATAGGYEFINKQRAADIHERSLIIIWRVVESKHHDQNHEGASRIDCPQQHVTLSTGTSIKVEVGKRSPLSSKRTLRTTAFGGPVYSPGTVGPPPDTVRGRHGFSYRSGIKDHKGRDAFDAVPSTSASTASRTFRPTWLAKLSNACSSFPCFHRTTNRALLSPVPSSIPTFATRSTDPGRFPPSSSWTSTYFPLVEGSQARALRLAERDHVSRQATTQTSLFGASEIDTASPASPFRIRCKVPV